jgi:hypothetical protein
MYILDFFRVLVGFTIEKVGLTSLAREHLTPKKKLLGENEGRTEKVGLTSSNSEPGEPATTHIKTVMGAGTLCLVSPRSAWTCKLSAYFESTDENIVNLVMTT